MNNSLYAEFTKDEVTCPLFQMNHLGAPGPDGFPTHFFQKHKSHLKNDVYWFVLKFLNHQENLDDVNSTFITLIPKIKNVVKVGDFRSIILCNVIHKIEANILANRLKPILPHIISANQSVVVHGWLIIDNIIIAYETLHSMINKYKGSNKFMALKLDMSKVYNRIK